MVSRLKRTMDMIVLFKSAIRRFLSFRHLISISFAHRALKHCNRESHSQQRDLLALVALQPPLSHSLSSPQDWLNNRKIAAQRTVQSPNCAGK